MLFSSLCQYQYHLLFSTSRVISRAWSKADWPYNKWSVIEKKISRSTKCWTDALECLVGHLDPTKVRTDHPSPWLGKSHGRH